MKVHVDPDALAKSIERLEAAIDPSGDGLEAGLRQVVQAADALFRVSGTGLMFVDPGNVLRYVVASDEPGKVLESAQEDVGEGPCVDALVYDRVVATEDVEVDPRWPRLTPLVVPRGVRAVLGAPVRLGGGPVGTLDAYVDAPHRWDDSEVEAIRAFGEVVENLVAAAVSARRRSVVVDQLRHALDNRVAVDRAVGVLMEREGLDAVAAFNRLRRAARNARRPVGEVARRLLEGGPLEPGRPA